MSVDRLKEIITSNEVQSAVEIIDIKLRGLREVSKDEAVRTAVDTVTRSEVQLDLGGSSRETIRNRENEIKAGSRSSLDRMRAYMQDGESLSDFQVRLQTEKSQKSAESHASQINILFGHPRDIQSVA